MADYRRRHVDTLVERLTEPPQRLIAVFGPRQTGKTTAVRHALESVALPYRLEAVDMPAETGSGLAPGAAVEDGGFTMLPGAVHDRRWLVEVWEDSKQRAWASERGFVLVLDEIQKIRGWSEAVKGLWDSDPDRNCPLHVVILGSAPLLMQAGLSESLAGRFETVRFTHWSFLEMADAFGIDLEQYLFFGGYPGATWLIQDFERWRAYVRDALIEPNIERDVLAMTRVDKPALLKRLLELGVLYSGQELSYNKMLGQLQDAGNTVTLSRYLTLLEHAGLLTGLSKHTQRPVLTKGSSPKLNVLNTALMAVFSRYTFEEARNDRTQWGHIVESAVGAHLLNSASSTTDVRYWRDGDHEVDFILRRGPRTVAVEVKSGRRRARHSGLAEFERRFMPHASFVVGEGNDIELGEFLSQPADHWIDTS
ncbi:MAG: ATP-binding protein [Acidimicrobiaceae bacterium]|nr:ATP-binding protein [Acidimicrobiaceae bacterium]